MMIIILIIYKLKMDYRVKRYAEFTKAFFIVKNQKILWYTCNCNYVYARNECSDISVAIISTKLTDIQLSLHANLLFRITNKLVIKF